MKKLTRHQVEEIIRFAEAKEIDNVVGVMVRLPLEGLAELKALTWLGRDMDNPKHWEALVIEASYKLDAETARYLADDPNLATTLRKGIDALESAGRL
jgi:hypothetical protein